MTIRIPRHRQQSVRRDAAALAAEAFHAPYDELRPIEEQFRQAAREVAKRLGYRCFHTYDSRRSDPGQPDETWVRPPRLIYAELKAPKGVYSEEQRDVLDLLAKCPGVEVYRIRSTGDRARDQLAIGQLLGPRARPARPAA
jgi:hypothetical protein